MQEFLNAISAISTLLTLSIALLLFDRYGIKKTIKEKQLEVVAGLLIDIKSLRFTLSDEKQCSFISFERGEYATLIRNSNHVEIATKYLLFGKQYLEKMEKIWKVLDNIYLPLSVKESFIPLQFCNLSGKKGAELKDLLANNHLAVDEMFNVGSNDTKFTEYYGYINDKKITVTDYFEQWNKTIDALKLWLKKNSGIREDELNI